MFCPWLYDSYIHTDTDTDTHTHTHTERERERESHRESLCNQGNKKYCVMDIRHQQSQ